MVTFYDNNVVFNGSLTIYQKSLDEYSGLFF